MNNLKVSRHILEEVWKSRKRYSSEEEIDSSSDKDDKKHFLEFDGNKIRARGYVGFIQYEGVSVNIYPKICKEQPKDNIVSQILYWLSYGKKINLPFAELSLDRQPFDSWLEAFIYLFAHHSEELLSNQPYQSYQEVTEETSYLRGQLAISEYVQHNLITGRHQFFHCTYEPFLYDNQFNRIVKFVSRLLLSNTKNDKSKDKLNGLLFLLNDVSDEFCQENQCDLVRLNPLYQDLSIVLEMCRMFMANSSISSSDSNKNNFCLLLPMEVVFEEFIFGFIEKHFQNRKPAAQKESYLAENENGKQVFKLKHDIILHGKDLIIDTKYKIREIKDNKKGISSNDIYQMLAYSIKRKTENVLLIYPSENHKTNDSIDTFTIENYNEKTIIHAIDINITGENNIIIEDNLKRKLSKVFDNL